MAITSTKIKQYRGSLSEVKNAIGSLGSISELNEEMSKTGFTGWRTAPHGEGVLVNDLSLVEGQVVDLYSTIPNLVTLTKTVRFVDYNDTEIQTQQVEIGKSATRPQNPTRENFKFWKWDTPFDCVT